jgi:oligoendopeptidase F
MVAGRLMSYAGLRYYQITTDPARAKFMADAQDRVTEATTPLVFFSAGGEPAIDDAALDALFAGDADLARYRPVFDRMRAMRPHQLSDELERFLHDSRPWAPPPGTGCSTRPSPPDLRRRGREPWRSRPR